MFNEEQQSFVHQPLTDGKLYGVPGGGKTTTILARIIRLINDKLIPEHNGFIVLTFSRSACSDFIARGQAIDKVRVFTHMNVCTIHSLSGRILYVLGADEPSSLKTSIYRASKIVQTVNSITLRCCVPCLRSVKTIIIDEAQDISEIQYNFICKLRDKLGATLVMVGDPNQNIYQFQGGSDKFLLNHPGFCVELRKNYRSTLQLVDVINRARPVVSDAGIISGHPVNGVKPVIVCTNIVNIKADLLCSLRTCIDEGHTIAVIGPNKKSAYGNSSILGGIIPGIGLNQVATWLYEDGIPYSTCYREDSDAFASQNVQTDKNESECSKSHVKLLTVHASKGLEFDYVFLLDFHRQYGTDIAIQNRRYVWFVGLSRAKKYMKVYCVAGRSIWQEYDKYRDLFDVSKTCGPNYIIDVIEPVSKPVMICTSFPWKKLLGDAVRLPENVFAFLEDKWIYLPSRTPRDSHDTFQEILPMEFKLRQVYNEWIINLIAFRCNGKEETPIIQHIADMANHYIVIPASLSRAAKMLIDAMQLDVSDIISWEHLDNFTFEHAELNNLITYLRNVRRSKKQVHEGVMLHVKDECRWFDPDRLRVVLKSCSGDNVPVSLFILCLFKWQYDNEARFVWESIMKDMQMFERHLQKFDKDIIDEVVKQWYNQTQVGWDFCKTCDMVVGASFQNKELKISARLDAVSRDGNEVVVIMFSNEINTLDLIYAAGCAKIAQYTYNLDKHPTCRVINIKNGKEEKIKLKCNDIVFDVHIKPLLSKAITSHRAR